MIKKISLFLLLFFYSPIIYAIDLTIYEGDEKWNKIDSLKWIDGPATIKHLNQGTITIDNTQSALVGEDARQIMYWINGVQFNIDVFVQDLSGGYADYSFDNSGYVKLDDWKDVNPDKFLKELQKGMKEGNKQRKERGFDTIVSIEWFREPKLNKEKNSVSYATNIFFSDNSRTINAALLILGRYGYAEATVVAGIDDFNLKGNQMLDSIILNYDFVEQKNILIFLQVIK